MIAVAVVALVLPSILGNVLRTPGSRHWLSHGDVLSGKAYGTDSNGIRAGGHEVRLTGLNAPGWDRWTQHRDSYWFHYGKCVKTELIRSPGW